MKTRSWPARFPKDQISPGPRFCCLLNVLETIVIFKKPFTLSDTVELMVGAGPAWSYTRDEGIKWGATFALDVMVWPWPERKFGWFVEPAYTINQDNEKSLSVSVGLLIAIP